MKPSGLYPCHRLYNEVLRDTTQGNSRSCGTRQGSPWSGVRWRFTTPLWSYPRDKSYPHAPVSLPVCGFVRMGGMSSRGYVPETTKNRLKKEEKPGCRDLATGPSASTSEGVIGGAGGGLGDSERSHLAIESDSKALLLGSWCSCPMLTSYGV